MSRRICVVTLHFDESLGRVIDVVEPEALLSVGLRQRLPLYALPNRVHERSLDYLPFVISPLSIQEPEEKEAAVAEAVAVAVAAEETVIGCACFRQTRSNEAPRGTVQSSLAILSIVGDLPSTPAELAQELFAIQQVLLMHSRRFFEAHESTLPDIAVLQTDIEKAFAGPLLLRNHIARVGAKLGWDALLSLLKCIYAGAKVVVQGIPLHELCATVLILATLSGSTSPLPLLPLEERALLPGKLGISGSSIPMQSMSDKFEIDVIVCIENEEVMMCVDKWEYMAELSSADRRFSNYLEQESLRIPEEIPNLFQQYWAYVQALRVSQLDESCVRDFNGFWLEELGIYDASEANALRLSDGNDDGAVVTHPFHEEGMLEMLQELPTVQALAPVISSIQEETKRGFALASSAFSSLISALPELSLEDNDEGDDAINQDNS